MFDKLQPIFKSFFLEVQSGKELIVVFFYILLYFVFINIVNKNTKILTGSFTQLLHPRNNTKESIYALPPDFYFVTW